MVHSNPSKRAKAADVTVFGAGIFGLTIAYACAQQGARVKVIERKSIGYGASHYALGGLAPYAPEHWNAEKQFQFDSLLMATAFWQKVEQISQKPTGFARLGRLQVIPDSQIDLAQTRANNSQTLWQNQAKWVLDPPMAHIAPNAWCFVPPLHRVVYDTLTARVQPRLALLALLHALRALDADIVFGHAPYATAQGKIVLAGGVEGLYFLNRALCAPIGTAIKGQALRFAYDGTALPQIYTDKLHIVPHSDATVAVGSTTEAKFTNPCATDALLTALEHKATMLCPALKTAHVIERWAAVRPKAARGKLLLGALPHRKSVFVANGGFKIGFGMAPMVGKVMANLILHDQNTIPPCFRFASAL